ncbi:hypothetical protein vBVpP1_01 [Vibrio phage vB_VpP_1]|nr:hypothetical protein vBVpP1_01 [Vibrio phage vB_VpP_1]
MKKVMTYDRVATKDDTAFMNACRHLMPMDYEVARAEADEAFKLAGTKTEKKMKKINAARRAANLVMLKWLKENGITDWRHRDDEQPARDTERTRGVERARTMPKPDVGYKPRKPSGRSGGSRLDQMMAEAVEKTRKLRK